MAKPTSREECVDRHREYPIDISGRLGGPGSLQYERIRLMVGPVEPGEHVLDVGCNSGYLVDFVDESVSVFGVDVSANLVAKAKRRLREAYVAEAEDLPFGDGTFDVVVLGEIIEHVHDPVAVLSEARRVASRLVVGSTPHEDGKWGTSSVDHHRFHVRCFTSTTLLEALVAADLREPKLSIVKNKAGTPQMYVFQGGV